MSSPLMVFAPGEIAQNGEDGGAWGMGQERGRGLELRQQIPKVPQFSSMAAGNLFLL